MENVSITRRMDGRVKDTLKKIILKQMNLEIDRTKVNNKKKQFNNLI